MSKFSIIFLFYLPYTIYSQEDFTTFDYCSICDKDIPGVHPACNCTPLPHRAEVQARNLDAIIAFREKVLYDHNSYRNRVASGQEMKVPEAADMMVLNWDSELEHLARCSALASFRHEAMYDKCNYNSKNEPYGQNIYIGDHFVRDLHSVSRDTQREWYFQIKHIYEDKIIDSFPETMSEIERFTQLVWSRTTHVGCARIWNVVDPYPGWKMVVICNYKSDISQDPGNVVGSPVYKKGEPCSACPNGTKCETEDYPALCGKLHPVPKLNVTVLGEDLDEEAADETDKKNKHKKADRGVKINAASDRNMERWLLIAASVSFLF